MFRLMKLNGFPTVEISLNSQNHGYETRQRGNLIFPFPRVNAIRSNYEYQLVTNWNNIPDRIKQNSSLKRFKREFIEFLLSGY